MAMTDLAKRRDYQVLLKVLRERRRRAGITQAQLASRLSIQQSVISKIERGERRLDVVELRLWCAALQIKFLDLVKELDDSLPFKQSNLERK